ncbi:hypothetical protein HDU93_003937, partial [Gonapodya sp. JEL0774]
NRGEKADIADRQKAEMEDMRKTLQQMNLAYEKRDREHEWDKAQIRDEIRRQQVHFQKREAELQNEAARLKPILQAQLEQHRRKEEEQKAEILRLQQEVEVRAVALQQREAENQRSMAEIQRAAQAHRYESDVRISELSSTVEFFESQLSQKEARIVNLDREVAHLRSRLAQVEDEGFEKGVRIAFLQKQVQERDRQLAAIRQTGGEPGLARSLNGTSGPGRAGSSAVAKPGVKASAVSGRTVVNQIMYATQRYSPQRSDEATLEIGDAVLCMFKFEDGWSAVGVSVVRFFSAKH